jgi:hypothetical protein
MRCKLFGDRKKVLCSKAYSKGVDLIAGRMRAHLDAGLGTLLYGRVLGIKPTILLKLPG